MVRLKGMRPIHLVLALVGLWGCSSTTNPAEPGGDAAVPPEEDAEAPIEDAGLPDAPRDCPGKPQAQTCAVLGVCAKGGVRYGCQGGSCPVGDVGGCSIESESDPTPQTHYVTTCCERPACTRTAIMDGQCADSGTAKMAWTCPWSKGKQLAKGPGSCVEQGGVVDPSVVSSATAMDYCCTK